ncbi:MAG: sigma-70 family RNA polymerase sigma factor [Lachnospiraceae bacterium]|nr:sigma-70 family RNA polymerase sigma factor [Lachnospiraceae bacterium]
MENTGVWLNTPWGEFLQKFADAMVCLFEVLGRKTADLLFSGKENRLKTISSQWILSEKRVDTKYRTASEHGSATGQMTSVEQALDQYGNAILRLAYSYLHNMSDAEDILQDTLIKYMQTAPEFENEAHRKAWLLRVAANLSKNRIQYNQLRETDELAETLIAEVKNDLSFLWEAVKALPHKYREAIHLFYQEGYSSKEISRILRRNESSIRSDLRRGREKLKEILKEAYDFE